MLWERWIGRPILPSPLDSVKENQMIIQFSIHLQIEQEKIGWLFNSPFTSKQSKEELNSHPILIPPTH